MSELVTVATVKSELSITGSTYDTMLGTMLDQVEGLMRSICARPNGWLASGWTDQSEYFDGEDHDHIRLTYTPIDTGDDLLIYIDGDLLDDSMYDLDAATGDLWLLGGAGGSGTVASRANFPRQTFPSMTRGPSPAFPRGTRNVKATYSGGYTNTAAIPPVLARIATDGVRFLFRERDVHQGLASHQMDQHSWTRPTGEQAVTLTGILTSALQASGHIRAGVWI